MVTLADLVVGSPDLRPGDVDWLHRLVAEWQLVSDLSFADLVLWVPVARAPDARVPVARVPVARVPDARVPGGGWLAAAHMRPTTAPTAYPEDVVGDVRRGPAAARLERAARTPPGALPLEREGPGRVRSQEVPVRHAGRVVAVLVRDMHPASPRVPSPLELAYLTCAGELLQMVSEGTFPYPGQPSDVEAAPRAGDGLLRLDRTGHVVYASPNALSAYRRLGVAADLLGVHLGATVAALTAAPGRLDEPRGSAALAAALRFGEPRDSEVEAQGTTVLLRAMPLLPAGERRGALVLVRDVTELRRRDRQLVGKDVTIREIHHRVKNNLQTVAALLRLQARRLPDPSARAALQESVRRVSSIALVHETLSLSLDESVAFDAIADRVLAMCAEVAAPESSVQVRRQGEFGTLAAEVATALAMVLTELVQNAVEHAFPAGVGSVLVTADRDDANLVVRVDDDGGGLPAGFDLDQSPRLGLQIVRTLVAGDLRGTIELRDRPAGGTRAVLTVPLTAPG